MIPIRLYIKDFMCYDTAFIDFTQFRSALIVGKTEGDDAEANGVGKTTIYRAIEYVLFNHSDFIIENIVRDDVDLCRVVFDFAVGDQEYRLARTRTRKGTTDLSLYERTSLAGEEELVLHKNDYTTLFDEKYWKPISGRRTSDTEKDLAKLLKINLKSFRVFVHFMQNDFTGLTTATSEKRKTILKDALNLIIYTKLEKIAKEKLSVLSRELTRCTTLVEGLGSPENEIIELQAQLATAEKELMARQKSLTILEDNIKNTNEKINQLTIEYNNLESKFSSLLTKEQSVLQDKIKVDTSIKEYQTKKSNLIKEAHGLVAEVKQLEETQTKLIALDYSQIDILNEMIEQKKVLITQHNVNIKNNLTEYEELKIPMPTDSVCKHCRQPMSDQHRQECLAKDQSRMTILQTSIKDSKQIITSLSQEIQASQQIISNLTMSKQHLEGINTKIAAKKKEIADKRQFNDEYVGLLKKYNDDLQEKEKTLAAVREELSNSSLNEGKSVKKQIEMEKQSGIDLATKMASVNKELTHFTNSKAILLNNIDQKNQSKQKKQDITALIKELDKKISLYPTVIQGFSSTGIPNLIIHNMLDDLQVETNKIISQLKPGLQLSFAVEKTTDDGEEVDTLDILYTVNGKKRYYQQLSGAMQLIVTFGLKLGLSFLLQDQMGISIKFLLLDELDQSLAKGRVDAFAEIIKFLQKEFTILVITHNDRLKDKFSHAILVEQDLNMVSTAHVVSSW